MWYFVPGLALVATVFAVTAESQTAGPPFNRWDVIVGVHPHVVVAGDFKHPGKASGLAIFWMKMFSGRS